MAPYAVQITMGRQWRGKVEEFSNVFHYDLDTPFATESGWKDLVDQIVGEWKALHTTNVQFIRARVHGPTHLTKVEDQMRYVADLTGTGSSTWSMAIAPELAAVVSCYVGRGPKGGKQFIRKYVHGDAIEPTGASPEMQRGIAALGTAQKAPYENVMDRLKNRTVGAAQLPICTPQGKHLPALSSFTTDPYLRTRQFRKGRRRKPATP